MGHESHIFSINFPAINIHIQMIFPSSQLSFGFPHIFSYFHMFPWFSYVFVWFSPSFPRIFTCSQCFSKVFPTFSQDFPPVFPVKTHHLRLISRRLRRLRVSQQRFLSLREPSVQALEELLISMEIAVTNGIILGTVLIINYWYYCD